MILTRRFIKPVLVRLGIAAAILLAPILWSAFGRHGYFQDAFCSCDGPGYYYFKNNVLCEVTPGHGDFGSPVYSLWPVAGGWEARSIAAASAAPASDYAFLVMTNDHRLTLRLRLQGGDLYELWGTNWMRYPRVYNVWSVWFQQFFPPPSERKAQRINCDNNLKQIGLAFRIWEGDHGDQYPFNLSTNVGGTLELCDPDQDGFDRNAWLFLQSMSNELSTTKLLICPRDQSKSVAASWAGLKAPNITYRFRSGTRISEANPREILAVCPIDGNVLYCDGTVLGRNGKLPKEESQ
jgi:hypothetical protein